MFKELGTFFKRRENIVNVTIAIILGAAINQVTNSLIQDMLWPLVKGLFESLEIRPWKLSYINLEKFLQSLANLLLILAIIYLLIVRRQKENQ